MSAESALLLPPELLIQTELHAVYRCYSDQGVLLYVGTSGQLGKRLAAHAQKAWFVQVRGITLEWYPTEVEALSAERRAIHVEHPRLNVQHRNTRPRNGQPRQRNGKRPVPPGSGAETRARILSLINQGYSASKAGKMAGKTDSYGRQVWREHMRETRGEATG